MNAKNDLVRTLEETRDAAEAAGEAFIAFVRSLLERLAEIGGPDEHR
jgi:hypothetical protein